MSGHLFCYRNCVASCTFCAHRDVNGRRPTCESARRACEKKSLVDTCGRLQFCSGLLKASLPGLLGYRRQTCQARDHLQGLLAPASLHSPVRTPSHLSPSRNKRRECRCPSPPSPCPLPPRAVGGGRSRSPDVDLSLSPSSPLSAAVARSGCDGRIRSTVVVAASGSKSCYGWRRRRRSLPAAPP
jgi:hypothetical protein